MGLVKHSQRFIQCTRPFRALSTRALQTGILNQPNFSFNPHSTLGSEKFVTAARPPALFLPGRRVGFSSGSSSSSGRRFEFALSPVPENPLGKGKYIQSAAALIIGDEILNGKTLDQNSHYFARYCFQRGIALKRIEVIADDENQIIEASRRMVKNYDFVITSGGIGPTHDDITYASLAKAFEQTLEFHAETQHRMDEMNKEKQWLSTQSPTQRAAARKMALFPDKSEVLFVAKNIWVPVVRMEGKLCIFPGIPSLFKEMLDGLTSFLPLPPSSERPLRIQIFTERPESMIAPYLTSLQARLKPYGIQIGSYPAMGQGVFVSLIGKDRLSGFDRGTLAGNGIKKSSCISITDIAKEVESEIDGEIVSEEEVAKKKAEGQEKGLRAQAASTSCFIASVTCQDQYHKMGS